MIQKSFLFVVAFLAYCVAPGPTILEVKAHSSSASLGIQARLDQMLWGNVLVDGAEGQDKSPVALVVTLRSVMGKEMGRDSIPINGRYRFPRVPEGEYVIQIEMDEKVVYREQFQLYGSKDGEVQKDIQLVWQSSASAADVVPGYERPEKTSAWFHEAEGLVRQGKQKEAVPLLEKVIQADSNDYEAWTEMGTAFFAIKKEKDAEKAYEKALELKPDYLLAQINLAKLQLSRKDFENAIKTLMSALASNAESAEVNYLLGEAFLGIKKGSEAVKYLYEALRLDPVGMADVHLRLGQLYDLAGYKDRAVKEYEQFLQKKPSSEKRKDLENYIEKNK